jgi:NADH-quinone oxidoreductase subunit C
MGIENKREDTPDPTLDLLVENFPDDILETGHPQGDTTIVIRPGSLKKVMEFLKSDPKMQFEILVDATAVDYAERNPRFDVVYHLLSLTFNRRLRVKVRVEEGAQLDSLAAFWSGADWLEREVWDMFGIHFAGHPNLKRILMYEEFEGHPLRKDYPIRKRQPLIGPKN